MRRTIAVEIGKSYATCGIVRTKTFCDLTFVSPAFDKGLTVTDQLLMLSFLCCSIADQRRKSVGFEQPVGFEQT